MLRDQVASESKARRSLEQRHSDSLAEAVEQARLLEAALSDATARTKEAEKLKVELNFAKEEAVRVRELHQEGDSRVSALLEEQAETLRQIEAARARGADLEEQVRIAREECDQASTALKEAALENERLLKTRASETDRLLRDQIAEADGDRAVLEHQFAEVRAELDRKERQLQEVQVQMEVLKADQVRADDELSSMSRQRDLLASERRKEVEDLRRDLEDGKTAIRDLKRRLTAQERVGQEIIKVATRIRDANVKAAATAQKYILASTKQSAGAAAGGAAAVSGTAVTPAEDFSASMMVMSSTTAGPSNASTFPSSSSFPPSAGLHRSPLLASTSLGGGAEDSSIDPTYPEAALAALSAFDDNSFLETIAKTGTTIRKWQKQCKDYRERARGKITYRNFAKGDLALFLPTRNSIAKPWAAFNGTSR